MAKQELKVGDIVLVVDDIGDSYGAFVGKIGEVLRIYSTRHPNKGIAVTFSGETMLPAHFGHTELHRLGNVDDTGHA